jgi:hypothetical protein
MTGSSFQLYPLHFPHYDPPDGGKPKFRRSQSSIARDTMRQVWTREAKQFKKWRLFQKAQAISGYETAIESAFQAAEKLFKSQGLVFDDFDSLYGDGDNEEISLFFFNISGADPSDALKQHVSLVRDAAARGDLAFFQRICKTMRNTKRRSRRDSLKHHILVHWIASSLWLASDHAGSIYLQQVLKKTVQENSYAKERSRLGLKGYDIAHTKPIITGCTKKHKFILSKGWTKLEPTSSR